MKDIQRLTDFTRRRLQGMQGFHPLRRAKLARQLRALEEAERDPLNTAITGFSQLADDASRNNFRTYASQVNAAYEMYEARSYYGAELFGSVVDMRTAFIAGDGASIITKNKASLDWTKRFFELNKLDGSGLIDLVTTSELEGRNLLTLKPDKYSSGLMKDKDIQFMRVVECLWVLNQYTVEEQDKIFKAALYKERGTDKDIKLSAKDSIYLTTGRRLYNDINSTPGRLHKVITDFQNFSRAKYDLRLNTHLFGKTTPTFETLDRENAAAIQSILQGSSTEGQSQKTGTWLFGDVFVGPAKLGLVEPSGSAGAAVEKDALMALKLVSSASGVPLQFLAWPELLSNRSTAENMMEMVSASTIKERRIWEEALTNLVRKAMVMDVDINGADNSIVDLEIKIQLPLTSIALVKSYIEAYGPLRDDVISGHTFIAGLPGAYNYEDEQKLIAKEKKERAKNSPMQNGALEEAMAAAKAAGQQGNGEGMKQDETDNEDELPPARGVE